ncbi:aryl-sulfate sulfotransferase [uncultured Sphaerochaeta sp.]|uniref:aryl-sulfate sulfotransferase n=1 Tax=uncultured Sphaerochaeta sp. TaxID=886478 RepID=UPI002A0A2BFA|nr:aryl-sulfate sulfotransferase [uncultured Sphaerochaeta sp.]
MTNKKRLYSLISLTLLLLLLFLILRRPFTIAITQFEQVPLSALAVIESREATQVTLVLPGRNQNDLRITFKGYDTYHEIPVLALYPGTRNEVAFYLTTRDGTSYQRTVTIKTGELPAAFPEIGYERVLPDQIAEGFTFLHLGRYDEEGNYGALPCAVDSYGTVRWYYTGDIGHVMKMTEKGTLLIQEGDSLVEMDLMGRKIRTLPPLMYGLHHDVAFMENGNLLALSTAPSSFEDGVVEIDGDTGAYLQGWDFREILDKNRPPQPRNLEPADWLHLNGIDYDHRDDSFIVSGRDQSAVVKVDRQSGNLRWILGNHEHWEEAYHPYLLQPEGSPFAWQWGQHAPMVHPELPGRVLLYDNGNERSYSDPLDPTENYSRAVEFEIDEKAMTVRQVWEYGTGNGSTTFTPFIGDANYLENGNRLICFGGITKNLEGEAVELFDFVNNSLNDMKISAKVIEVTSDSPAKEVLVFSFNDPDPRSYAGYRVYQAERYPLYHPSLLQ